MRVASSLVLSLALAVTGCGDSDDTSPNDAEMSDGGGAGAPGEDFFSLGVPCQDDAADLYGDPGDLPDGPGEIVRCADDGVMTQAEIADLLAGLSADSSAEEGGVLNTYQGQMPEGGAHLYRVLYRTERGNGDPGASVAVMYVPDPAPKQRLPLVLLARGSRGQAPTCAPSLTTKGAVSKEDNTDGRYVQEDLDAMVWPLVAAGFAVAVTDSAGYANYGADGNPPAGYADAQDAGKSFLDSGRALHELLPEGTTDDVLMVGLSQGGHTVLSSLEVANDYGAPGTIRGAAVYSPLWFAQRAWGIAMSEVARGAGLFLNASSAVPVSIWYHYTHAELHDGPGEGVKLFKPELQSAVKEFVDTICWSQSYKQLADAIADPPEAGIAAADYFSEELAAAVGQAAFQRSCDESPDKPLCEKWLQRYRDDHPVLTGEAAQVPILMAYGLKDTTINAPRFKCGVEKLRLSDNELDFCIDPDANHAGVVLTQSDYVNQWLASKVSGAEVTLECPSSKPPSEACDLLLPND
jgi:alpha-beta hydrolase superfamily lysophospholipase